MQNATAPASSRFDAVFAGLFGAWIGLSFLKFGNPSLFTTRIAVPEDSLQLLIDPWPLIWGYALMVPLGLIGIRRWNWPRGVPAWIMALPAIWFGVQVLSAFRTIDSTVTAATILHFLSVVAAFYLGLGIFSQFRDLRWFWVLVLSAFAVVLLVGFYQHFGGLEATRRYAQIYEFPKYPNGPPPELVKKLASNRIYSTLFYPNTLAAVVILMSPLLLTKLSQLHATRPAKTVLLVAAGLAGVLCLYWSGSKAGWLISLGMVAVALTRVRVSTRLKLIAVTILCAAGLIGFIWRYSTYLERGATSATARLDYWKAAVRACAERPVLGYGPGTFMLSYKRLKRPEAEMARLAHNDYLQQASDSGVPGFVCFSLFIGGSLYFLYRRSASDPVQFAVWLSLLGLSVHSFFEFHLYVPALAWPQFFFFGWLWGKPKPQ